MVSYTFPTAPTSFSALCQSFGQHTGLPFADVLSEDTIVQAARRHHAHFATGPDDVWNLSLTLWIFLTQCLSAAKDCASAVARAIVWRVQHGLTAPSANTGAYCKARAKLPLPLLQELTRHSGQTLEQQTPSSWRWRDRRVLLLDGSTASLPDTPANQEAYPQSNQQEPGLGFPMIRLVVLLTFATAALVDAALGPCEGEGTSELALFRQLLDTVRPGDVLVADREYCTYWLVAWLVERRADVAFRLHGARQLHRSDSHRLAKDDWLIRWERPARWAWMDKATWQRLPEFLILRLVRVRVSRPGYRTRLIKVVTTLGDRDILHDHIAELYHWRWHVELDLRNLKSTLALAPLRCLTPQMVDKELWTHLLGYNLLRTLLAQAAQAGGCRPRQLSFAAAVHTWQEFRLLLQDSCGAVYQTQLQNLWGVLLVHRVGQRPGRIEPRRLKRWRHKYPRLTCPRAQARAQLLADGTDSQRRPQDGAAAQEVNR